MMRLAAWLIAFSIWSAGTFSFEVNFENKDSGYFLKPLHGDLWSDEVEFKHHVERFTILNPTQINMIRISYGPFTAKQTVPAVAFLQPNQSGVHSVTVFDVTARIVTKEVRRDQPLLRVLFHLGIGGRDAKLKLGLRTVCITLIAERDGERLTTSCVLSPKDGISLAELTIPAHWWPPLDQVQSIKPRNLVHLEYTLSEGECASLFPNVPSQPTIRLEDVVLSSTHGQYLELKQDEIVRILIPQGTVYPRSRIYAPVYMHPNPAYPVYVFVLRARAKNGVRILGAQVSQPDKWTINIETNPKQTMATVTAFVKDTTTESPVMRSEESQEVFTWLLEVDENINAYDGGRIIWNLRYVLDSNLAEQYNFDENVIKLTSQLDIQKDDIQAVLPLAKSWELLNTAVLNGKQVSHPMKVYIVSQAGKVADVTVQTSCKSVDESVLKVSSSCTLVYLDGSEIRGSHNATVIVNYGSYTGHAQFTVWVPEFPLDIQVVDTKLSQIKGWKVPPPQQIKSKVVVTDGNFINGGNTLEDEKPCHLRFQQTPVSVYARFFSVDDNSGRETYLLNRKAALHITDLVENSLRIADTRIASLKGMIVQGQLVGRTEIQVLSPITGRVIGAREIRVSNDKVNVDDIQVTIVTGLQLSILRDEDFSNTYLAQTTISHKLTAQYQEGLLDVRLRFSDGTVTSVAQIADSDYHLLADSLDSGIIAFAPKFAQQHPRVIAVGQGKGDLLHVRFEMSDICQRRRFAPLASTEVYVDIDFFNVHQPEGVQNDGLESKNELMKTVNRFREDKSHLFIAGDPSHIKAHKSLKHYEPSVQARHNPLFHPLGLSPLEIGMCALLGIFCVAIITFVVSCGVYAVRYRRKQLPPGSSNDSVTNAHDWVWLGRSNLKTCNAGSRGPQNATSLSDMNGNQANKPNMRDKGSNAPSSNRSSGISYPGSEVNIHITNNPQVEDTTLTVSNEACVRPEATQACEMEEDESMPPPVPERRVRIQSNPISINPPEESLQPMDGSATFTVKKPPVPPHAVPVIVEGVASSSKQPAVKNKGVCIVPAKKPAKVDKAVHLSDAEWQSAGHSLNYNQLIEYFDGLKESNA